jgi:hypothetical protein
MKMISDFEKILIDIYREKRHLLETQMAMVWKRFDNEKVCFTYQNFSKINKGKSIYLQEPIDFPFELTLKICKIELGKSISLRGKSIYPIEK